VIVIKIGGGEGIGLDSLCDDIAALRAAGERLVIVHGASHATNVLSERLNHPAQTIVSPSGHTSRRTDRQTLEIFQMACRGVMNQSLVLELLRRGVDAVGLSGVDARLWVGERKAAIRSVEDGRVRIIRDDFSGTVERTDPRLLTTLLEAGYTPVVSPPALSTHGEAINVDADRAAAQTAIALRAETLLLLSNVPGLLARYPDPGSLLTSVPASGIEMASEFAQGRMKKKVLAAGEALSGGVGKVVIGDARAHLPISRALDGVGTVFA